MDIRQILIVILIIIALIVLIGLVCLCIFLFRASNDETGITPVADNNSQIDREMKTMMQNNFQVHPNGGNVSENEVFHIVEKKIVVFAHDIIRE